MSSPKIEFVVASLNLLSIVALEDPLGEKIFREANVIEAIRLCGGLISVPSDISSSDSRSQSLHSYSVRSQVLNNIDDVSAPLLVQAKINCILACRTLSSFLRSPRTENYILEYDFCSLALSFSPFVLPFPSVSKVVSSI